MSVLSKPPGNPHAEVVGNVLKVELDKPKPYAVTRTDSYPGSVTFSLSVWQGKDPPVAGQVVLLGGVIEMGKGLRASSARPRPIPERRKKKGHRKEQET